MDERQEYVVQVEGREFARRATRVGGRSAAIRAIRAGYPKAEVVHDGEVVATAEPNTHGDVVVYGLDWETEPEDAAVA